MPKLVYSLVTIPILELWAKWVKGGEDTGRECTQVFYWRTDTIDFILYF